MALMAVDVGTTGIKTAVYDENGCQLALKYWEYDRPQGSTEYDGERIWTKLREMIPAAVDEGGQAVTAVGVCSQGEAVAPIGRDGKALYPFLQNTDLRGKPCLDALSEEQKELIRRRGLLAPHPRYALAKMLYIRQREREIFSRLWKYMLFEDFIVYKLTGQAVSDLSIATRTNVFDQSKKAYDAEILSWAGITPEQLPRLLPTGSAAGTVRSMLAGELHLSPETQVVLCGHDCIPENLCSGVLSPSVSSLGCGTAEGVGVLTAEKDLDGEAVLAANLGCERYPVEDFRLLFGFNANSGSVAKWYRDRFGTPLGKDYRTLDAAMPEGPSGLLAIPHFSGSSTPDFNSAAAGAIAGLRYSHGPEDIYKALLEGTAYELRFILERMRRAGLAVEEFRVSGGGARSPQWLQIKADILGVPIVPLLRQDATLGGCAMLAGTAAGIYPSLEAAAERYVFTGRPILPNPEDRSEYDRLYGRYKALRALLTDSWA